MTLLFSTPPLIISDRSLKTEMIDDNDEILEANVEEARRNLFFVKVSGEKHRRSNTLKRRQPVSRALGAKDKNQ